MKAKFMQSRQQQGAALSPPLLLLQEVQHLLLAMLMPLLNVPVCLHSLARIRHTSNVLNISRIGCCNGVSRRKQHCSTSCRWWLCLLLLCIPAALYTAFAEQHEVAQSASARVAESNPINDDAGAARPSAGAVNGDSDLHTAAVGVGDFYSDEIPVETFRYIDADHGSPTAGAAIRHSHAAANRVAASSAASNSTSSTVEAIAHMNGREWLNAVTIVPYSFSALSNTSKRAAAVASCASERLRPAAVSIFEGKKKTTAAAADDAVATGGGGREAAALAAEAALAANGKKSASKGSVAAETRAATIARVWAPLVVPEAKAGGRAAGRATAQVEALETEAVRTASENLTETEEEGDAAATDPASTATTAAVVAALPSGGRREDVEDAAEGPSASTSATPVARFHFQENAIAKHAATAAENSSSLTAEEEKAPQTTGAGSPLNPSDFYFEDLFCTYGEGECASLISFSLQKLHSLWDYFRKTLSPSAPTHPSSVASAAIHSVSPLLPASPTPCTTRSKAAFVADDAAAGAVGGVHHSPARHAFHSLAAVSPATTTTAAAAKADISAAISAAEAAAPTAGAAASPVTEGRIPKVGEETCFGLAEGAGCRAIQIAASAVAVVLLLLLLSQIFWRYRVHRYNQLGEWDVFSQQQKLQKSRSTSSSYRMPKSVHEWTSFSASSSPRYCSVCRQLISGFLIYRNSGWSCLLCQRYAHSKCLRAAEKLDCKTPCLAAPIHHVFVEGNLSADAICCCCGLACSSNFGLDGLRCLWCTRTLHESCKHKLPSSVCDFGPCRLLMLPPTAVKLSFSLLSANAVLLRVASSLYGRVGLRAVMKQGFKEGLKEVKESVKRLNAAIVVPLRKKLNVNVHIGHRKTETPASSKNGGDATIAPGSSGDAVADAFAVEDSSKAGEVAAADDAPSEDRNAPVLFPASADAAAAAPLVSEAATASAAAPVRENAAATPLASGAAVATGAASSAATEIASPVLAATAAAERKSARAAAHSSARKAAFTSTSASGDTVTDAHFLYQKDSGAVAVSGRGDAGAAALVVSGHTAGGGVHGVDDGKVDFLGVSDGAGFTTGSKVAVSSSSGGVGNGSVVVEQPQKEQQVEDGDGVQLRSREQKSSSEKASSPEQKRSSSLFGDCEWKIGAVTNSDDAAVPFSSQCVFPVAARSADAETVSTTLTSEAASGLATTTPSTVVEAAATTTTPATTNARTKEEAKGPNLPRNSRKSRDGRDKRRRASMGQRAGNRGFHSAADTAEAAVAANEDGDESLEEWSSSSSSSPRTKSPLEKKGLHIPRKWVRRASEELATLLQLETAADYQQQQQRRQRVAAASTGAEISPKPKVPPADSRARSPSRSPTCAILEQQRLLQQEPRAEREELEGVLGQQTCKEVGESRRIGGSVSSHRKKRSGALDRKNTEMRYTVARVMPPKAPVWRLRSNAALWFADPAATPLLVFVNVKSGGQMGTSIYRDLVALLNPIQVVDIQADKGPERALTLFLPLAKTRRLRVLVCGGDGTVGWVLAAIHKLYGPSSTAKSAASEKQLSTASSKALSSPRPSLPSTPASPPHASTQSPQSVALPLQSHKTFSTRSPAQASVPSASAQTSQPTTRSSTRQNPLSPSSSSPPVSAHSPHSSSSPRLPQQPLSSDPSLQQSAEHRPPPPPAAAPLLRLPPRPVPPSSPLRHLRPPRPSPSQTPLLVVPRLSPSRLPQNSPPFSRPPTTPLVRQSPPPPLPPPTPPSPAPPGSGHKELSASQEASSPATQRRPPHPVGLEETPREVSTCTPHASANAQSSLKEAQLGKQGERVVADNAAKPVLWNAKGEETQQVRKRAQWFKGKKGEEEASFSRFEQKNKENTSEVRECQQQTETKKEKRRRKSLQSLQLDEKGAERARGSSEERRRVAGAFELAEKTLCGQESVAENHWREEELSRQAETAAIAEHDVKGQEVLTLERNRTRTPDSREKEKALKRKVEAKETPRLQQERKADEGSLEKKATEDSDEQPPHTEVSTDVFLSRREKLRHAWLPSDSGHQRCTGAAHATAAPVDAAEFPRLRRRGSSNSSTCSSYASSVELDTCEDEAETGRVRSIDAGDETAKEAPVRKLQKKRQQRPLQQLVTHSSCGLVPVAICPLGTGNDLSNVLGWGFAFDGDMMKHLLKVQSAITSTLDLWRVQVFKSTSKEGAAPSVDTTFSNYLDVGVAARIVLRFHKLREENPELFQSRVSCSNLHACLGNKFLYGEVGFRDFIASPNISLLGLRIFCDGEEIAVPYAPLEGVCVVNIPSFAGGVELWESPFFAENGAAGRAPTTKGSRREGGGGESLVCGSGEEDVFFLRARRRAVGDVATEARRRGLSSSLFFQTRDQQNAPPSTTPPLGSRFFSPALSLHHNDSRGCKSSGCDCCCRVLCRHCSCLLSQHSHSSDPPDHPQPQHSLCLEDRKFSPFPKPPAVLAAATKKSSATLHQRIPTETKEEEELCCLPATSSSSTTCATTSVGAASSGGAATTTTTTTGSRAAQSFSYCCCCFFPSHPHPQRHSPPHPTRHHHPHHLLDRDPKKQPKPHHQNHRNHHHHPHHHHHHHHEHHPGNQPEPHHHQHHHHHHQHHDDEDEEKKTHPPPSPYLPDFHREHHHVVSHRQWPEETTASEQKPPLREELQQQVPTEKQKSALSFCRRNNTKPRKSQSLRSCRSTGSTSSSRTSDRRAARVAGGKNSRRTSKIGNEETREEELARTELEAAERPESPTWFSLNSTKASPSNSNSNGSGKSLVRVASSSLEKQKKQEQLEEKDAEEGSSTSEAAFSRSCAGSRRAFDSSCTAVNKRRFHKSSPTQQQQSPAQPRECLVVGEGDETTASKVHFPSAATTAAAVAAVGESQRGSCGCSQQRQEEEEESQETTITHNRREGKKTKALLLQSLSLQPPPSSQPLAGLSQAALHSAAAISRENNQISFSSNSSSSDHHGRASLTSCPCCCCCARLLRSSSESRDSRRCCNNSCSVPSTAASCVCCSFSCCCCCCPFCSGEHQQQLAVAPYSSSSRRRRSDAEEESAVSLLRRRSSLALTTSPARAASAENCWLAAATADVADCMHAEPPPAPAVAGRALQGRSSGKFSLGERGPAEQRCCSTTEKEEKKPQRQRVVEQHRKQQQQQQRKQQLLWKRQSINDQLLEVVGFKSLFHLGQVQVGLAKPVKICQGRSIRIMLPQSVPLQIDGEPMVLQDNTTLEISYNGETPVLLAPDKSAQTQSFAMIQQVLATAYGRGLLNEFQCTQLLNDFQRTL